MSVPAKVRLGLPPVAVDRPVVDVYPPGTATGPRTLTGFEFGWLLSGSGIWYRTPERVALTPGVLLLIPPGPPDQFRWDARRAVRCGRVRFQLSGTPDTSAWPRAHSTGRDDPLRGLTRYLLWLGSREPPGWQDRVADVLGLMLSVFVSGPLPDTTPEPDLPRALDPILDHVRAAWAAGPLRPLARSELARAAAMSPGHLSRTFRQYCGIGAIAAFEALRLTRAQALLRGGDLSVRAVGEACGFADPYHFAHRFKATYGISPRSYRDGVEPTRPGAAASPSVRLLAHRIWGTPR